MRVLPVSAVLFVAGAALALAGCQDGAASNPERDTHMGTLRAAADPWPALPPAPTGAAPVSLSAAAPALVAIASAPPAPPEPPPPGLMAPHPGMPGPGMGHHVTINPGAPGNAPPPPPGLQRPH
jgi:hypothetical protein